MDAKALRIDLIIPIYNEHEAIQAFHTQLRAAIDSLPYHFHIYYINDGSTDRTGELLEQLSDNDDRVTVVELSRNFGHQAALTAGLDLAEGDYVITMDGDGQHPPEYIPEMIDTAVRGNLDIILMQRMEQANQTSFKSGSSSLFYRLINRIGDTQIVPGAADFRLMARPAVLALRSMREYHRFLRGMVNWIGYRTAILPYVQPARLAGHSKYTLRKMFRLGTNAIFSFSLVPLYIAISIGGLFLVLALVEAIYVLSFWINGNQSQLAPGWSSLMFMLLIVGGALMVALGLIGIYIGYIFQEVKSRPIYLIRRTYTHPPASTPPD